MYRYRLIDDGTGVDLGPLVSQRLLWAAGESIARRRGERYVVVRTVQPENENFRAYVVVRPVSADANDLAQSPGRVLPQGVA